MKTILLIDENGTNLGKVAFSEAKNIAAQKSLDLIEVSKDKAVFKLGDRAKLNYERKQRERQRKARMRDQQKSHKVKQIQLRPTTDSGDLAIKTKKLKEFLDSGLKTKLVMRFKRSQLGYSDLGLQKVQALVDEMVEAGLATVDKPPKLEGNNIFVLLIPSSK